MTQARVTDTAAASSRLWACRSASPSRPTLLLLGSRWVAMRGPKIRPASARLVRTLAAALLVCLPLYGAAGVEEDNLTTVSAEGSAPGAGGEARTMAVDEAQREAVLKVLQEFIPTRDFSLLHQIIDSAPLYVYSFQLQDQRQEDGGAWVSIEAEVNEEQLRRDAAEIILQDLHELPTTLVLTADYAFEDGPYLGAPRNESMKHFREFLKAHEIPEVDWSELEDFHDTGELYAFLEGDAEGMTRLGRTHGAEVVLYGETRQRIGESVGANVVAVHATVDMRVLRAAGGEVIETIETEAIVHAAEARQAGARALEDACAKATQEALVALVLAAFDTDANEYIRVTLEDVEHEDELRQVLEALEAAAGVEPEVLYRGASHARIHLPYDGSMAYLTDSVSDRSYDGFRIRARHIVGRVMTLQVMEDGR